VRRVGRAGGQVMKVGDRNSVDMNPFKRMERGIDSTETDEDGDVQPRLNSWVWS
jgi:hypothetical protein